MSMEVLIPLLAALAGALIGSVGTVSSVWIQARKEDRRHVRELAFRMASEMRQLQFDALKDKSGAIGPIDYYVAYTLNLVRAADAGPITVATLESLSEQSDRIHQFTVERERARENQSALRD